MPTPEELQQRRLEREVSARKQAEKLLEEKSLELFIEAQERRAALDQLKESEERYRVIVETSPDAILVIQDDRLAFFNGAARRMLASAAAPPQPDAGLEQFNLLADAARADRHPGQPVETSALKTDGSTIEVALSSVPIVFDRQPARQIVLRDISDRKRLERQLAFQATHDPLTGVANRAALLEQLDDTLAYARRHGVPVWVGFLDLDHFKQINDRFGHRAGDRLLETVTSRLRALLRKDDIIGRYGGDEFVLVMRGGAADALGPTLLDRIMAAVCQPVDFDGYALAVTCSLGIAGYPEDADDGQLLLERADAAMYRAKESGRNLCQLYNDEIHARIVERTKIESALAQAIERNEFFVLYQPQIDARDGTVVGAEALLRWRHSELGVLTPDRFLQFAEQSALINRIGAWVLAQACSACASWHAAGHRPLRIAVNLSVRQLNGIELIKLVDDALQATGLPAACLELELTESMVMSDAELALDTLGALHQRGVQVAIDDFGTGYSNFAYLNRLPLNCLKIDKQFVSDIEQPGGAIVTHALIQLAHSLGLTVVAEGVETAAQLRVLREQGCDQIQGWLHSKAMSAQEFLGMLRHYEPSSWMSEVSARKMSA
ncbi:MAG: bifunctional diguanylate cyclase/phosphodiesterase [Burkholderiaceae bacterium]|nr:bifunctional diguanylate cyclase/phosphodiesterase [Burkholderiaceae bacterium]